MKSTIEIYEEELTRCYIPNYPQLPEEKQLALISMYYNLGYYGFKKLGIAEYANRKDWDSVIYFLNKNKLYQKQVPYRFKEIIKLLEK
jgi:GH24 family phage-related lysozyme (muramidase)